MNVLLFPCPVCGEDQLIELVEDDAGRGFRAPGVIDIMNEHVVNVHGLGVSGM